MGLPQCVVHVVAAKLGCKEAMIGSEWVNSHPGCMNRQRKCYSHLLGVHSRQERLLGFEGYLPTKNANYILHAR